MNTIDPACPNKIIADYAPRPHPDTGSWIENIIGF
jgi:hypothetical protein